MKDVAGAKGLTVRNCRIENVGIGVNAQYAGSKDFYIADNVFLGRDDRHRVLGWANPGLYGAHPINSYYAIKVYGSGHVIAHNAVAFFHDGISVCTHGVPDPERDRWAVAIDIYNNDIHVTGDDFIEADGGVHNIRVMRNRGMNAAHTGLSAQPIFGGPAYYIRNIVYNTPVALKFINPAGRDRVPQHVRRGESHRPAGLERALREQPVPRDRRARRGLHRWADRRRTRRTTTTASGRIAAPSSSIPGRDPVRACVWTTTVRRIRRSGSRRSRSSRQLPVQRRTESKWTTTSSSECARRLRRTRRSQGRLTRRRISTSG